MIAINTPTLEDYIMVVSWYLEHGKAWVGINTCINEYLWDNLKSNTCIVIMGNRLAYSSVDFVRNTYNAKIRDMLFFQGYIARLHVKRFKRTFNLK